MRLCWDEAAWQHYLFWEDTDKAVLNKINGLLKECSRTPFTGTGKPEPLKGRLRGYWSRRITQEHRLIYQIVGNDLCVAQCRFHYDDK